MTYFCYTDESGTPEVPGTSAHFVLVGFVIPIQYWREADKQLTSILKGYDLAEAEIHTAWLLRKYVEQVKIKDFERLDYSSRRSAAQRFRASELLRLRKLKGSSYKQAKKNFQNTEPYIHLTLGERKKLVGELVDCIKSWEWATIFAEAIDKLHFDPVKTKRSVSEQAFEQIVSRFEQFLIRDHVSSDQYGVLVHDNNQTVAKKHTDMMRHFHDQGTLWSAIARIGETPLFVDSKLTRMVQIADLCSYILRRYLENGENEHVALIVQRADTIIMPAERDDVPGNAVAVGIRHYSNKACICDICFAHNPRRTASLRNLKARHPNGTVNSKSTPPRL